MPNRRLVRWVIIVICIYLIVTTLRSMVDLWRARDKLTRRELALAALQAQNDDLLRQQNEASSPDYLEKVARDQLGMGRPGEQVVIIPAEFLSQGPVASPDNVANWKKWVSLLF